MRRLRLILPLLILAVLAPATSNGQNALAAVTAVPEGLYPCQNSDPQAPKRQVFIENEANYSLFMNNDAEQIPGLYSFQGGWLKWLSGPLKDRQPGRYEVDGLQRPPRMRLTIWDGIASPYHCRLPPPEPARPAP